MRAETLECKALSVARGGVSLFAELDWKAEAGDVWAIRGDNGCGKSSLFDAISGLLRPQSGEVRYGDGPIAERIHPTPCIQYIAHKRALRLRMTVRQNVAYWAGLYRSDELVDTALHYFDLESFADMPCEKLSAGWRERVTLTRLITAPAPIWLLDEPFTHLDSGAVALLQSLIQSRTEQGGIVCLTSHQAIEGDKIKTLYLNALL